eukprot:sb/3462966/
MSESGTNMSNEADANQSNSLLCGIFAVCTASVLGFSVWSIVLNLRRKTLSGKLYIIIHVLDCLVVFLVTLRYGLGKSTLNKYLGGVDVTQLFIFCAGCWTAVLSTLRLIVIASPFYQIKKKLLWFGSIAAMLVYVSITFFALQLTDDPDNVEATLKNHLIIIIVMPMVILSVIAGTTLAIFILLRKPNPEVPISPEKRRASWNVIFVTLVYFYYYFSHLSVYIVRIFLKTYEHPVLDALNIYGWSAYVFHSLATPIIVIRVELKEAVVGLTNKVTPYFPCCGDGKTGKVTPQSSAPQETGSSVVQSSQASVVISRRSSRSLGAVSGVDRRGGRLVGLVAGRTIDRERGKSKKSKSRSLPIIGYACGAYFRDMSESVTNVSDSVTNISVESDINQSNPLLCGIFAVCSAGVLGFSVWSIVLNLKRKTLSGKLYIIIHVLDCLVVFLVTLKYGLGESTLNKYLGDVDVTRLFIFCAGCWTAVLSTLRLIVIASPFYQIKKKLLWFGSIAAMLVYVSITFLVLQLTEDPDNVVVTFKNHLIIIIVMPMVVLSVIAGTTLAIFILLRKPNPEVPISPEKRRASWNVIFVTLVYFSPLGVYCPIPLAEIRTPGRISAQYICLVRVCISLSRHTHDCDPS